LSAKLMANRSDRHLSNLSNCQGAKPVRLIRRRCADFHHGPERNAALQQQAGYMTAIAHQAIRAATLRTGLGPYMTVRIRVLISADSLLESLNSARQRHPTALKRRWPRQGWTIWSRLIPAHVTALRFQMCPSSTKPRPSATGRLYPDSFTRLWPSLDEDAFCLTSQTRNAIDSRTLGVCPPDACDKGRWPRRWRRPAPGFSDESVPCYGRRRQRSEGSHGTGG